MRILEVGSVSIARVLYQRRRRKELGMTGPSRSSPWGIQRGKEIPETIKTGTKHQNKNKTNKTKQNNKKKKTRKKRKAVNTRRTKGEKRHAGKQTKKKALVYPCQNQ